MLKTERDIYGAGKSLKYLYKLADLDRHFLAEHGMLDEFARDPNRRMSAAALLTSARSDLPEDQRLGLLMYNSFIVSVDDLLDRDTNNTFQDPGDLRRFILSTQMPTTEARLTGEKLYRQTLNCFTEEKQLILVSYFEDMLKLHLEGDNNGKPGAYGFGEAREYKERTNIPFFRTGLILGDSPIANANIDPMIMGIQYFEDAIDWREDLEDNTLNMLIGMANDVWLNMGRPDWQDFDYLVKMAGNPDKIMILAKSNMKRTREAYKSAFFEEFEGQVNVPLALSVKLAGRLAL